MAGGSFWPADGKDRAHIPPTPLWIAVIRACQFFLALVVMALSAYAVSDLQKAPGYGVIKNWAGAEGYPMSWFAFAWTFVYVGWIILAMTTMPALYNYWVHL